VGERVGPNDEVVNAVEGIQGLVSGGKTVSSACQMLAGYGLSSGVLALARARYEENVGIISHLKEPIAITGDRERNWYGGPGPSPLYWGEFRQNIHATLPEDVADGALKDIDDVTSRVLDLAGAPGWPQVRTKGLVLGYVQSGKTTNFMGVMAKAADEGYRLFIVLSGITDNLRSQTQSRIEEVLIGDHPERWYLLTHLDQDFAMTGNAANLLNDRTQRLVAVVKKNGFRLRRLKNWIETAGPEVVKSLPIIVIDDEADQASLDVGKTGRISRINGLIGQIIAHPRSSYIAYTATPFANLLTQVTRYESLYPDDFIVEMSQPDGYFGPERLFGREALSDDEQATVSAGLDVIRIIPDAEAAMAKPPSGKGAVYGWTPSVTKELGDAIRWFLLATTARRARWSKSSDSTMLVHTSMLAESHNRMKVPVETFLATMAARIRSDDAVWSSLRDLWIRESAAVPAESLGLSKVSWEEVEKILPAVLAETKVIVDNYTSQDRLNYVKGEPSTVIVIGGNTLSRGLTLEGLVSSYFVRAASAYDTLLQMGRWFGYRRGYEDLPRIWMPEELSRWFQDLATVEEEIRRDIRAYGPNLTPKEVGVMIRVHPSMAITSAAKMRGAVDAAIDYSKKREQTITFNHQDKKWLGANIDATRQLFVDMVDGASGASVDDNEKTGRVVVRGVPADRVLEFFDAYKMHPNALRLRADLITGYVRQQMSRGALLKWNLVLLENPNREIAEGLDLGIGRGVRTLERSRLERYSKYANIKSLVSTIDRIADTGVARSELPGNVNPSEDAELAEFRQDIVGNVGLLAFYPIDKGSKMRPYVPGPGKEPPQDPRADLAAVDHVIGLGIFFPAAVGDPAVRYKSANIKAPVEDDSDEFDAMERADELAAEAEGDVSNSGAAT